MNEEEHEELARWLPCHPGRWVASPENQTVRNTATMFSHNGKPFSRTFTAEQAKQLQFIHY